MARTKHKLSVVQAKKELPPGLYGDGGGLYLQVSAYKTKSWVFRFMINGNARKMGLGDFELVTLADARKKAEAAHLLVVDGVDPIVEREKRRAANALEQAKLKTFKEAATEFIKDHASGWKSAKHAQQWTNTLKTYAYPTIGHLSVADIDVALVLKVIKPIWEKKTETANRVRGRIEQVLGWAKAMKLRDGDNPAAWRGNLEHLLPARSEVNPIRRCLIAICQRSCNR
jgi:hypothetical protein